jgi:hypothetical protein
VHATAHPAGSAIDGAHGDMSLYVLYDSWRAALGTCRWNKSGICTLRIPNPHRCSVPVHAAPGFPGRVDVDTIIGCQSGTGWIVEAPPQLQRNSRSWSLYVRCERSRHFGSLDRPAMARQYRKPGATRTQATPRARTRLFTGDTLYTPGGYLPSGAPQFGVINGA